MACSNPQECDGGAFRVPATLFPIAKRVNTDSHGLSELGLGETHESAQRRDVVAGLELSGHETVAEPCGDRSGEIPVGELGDVGHRLSSMLGMVKSLLALVGPASTDDASRLVFAFSPHYKNQTTRDRADREETILSLRVGFIEDLEVVAASGEQLLGLLEGDAMLALICEILGLVPFDPHAGIVSERWDSVNGLGR